MLCFSLFQSLVKIDCSLYVSKEVFSLQRERELFIFTPFFFFLGKVYQCKNPLQWFSGDRRMAVCCQAAGVRRFRQVDFDSVDVVWHLAVSQSCLLEESLSSLLHLFTLPPIIRVFLNTATFGLNYATDDILCRIFSIDISCIFIQNYQNNRRSLGRKAP